MTQNVQSADTGQALAQQYGIIGAVRLRLDETIVPVVLVDDITRAPVADGANAITAIQAALDTDINQFLIRNPPDSHTVCILERIHVYARTLDVGVGFVAGRVNLSCNLVDDTITSFPTNWATVNSDSWRDANRIRDGEFPTARPVTKVHTKANGVLIGFKQALNFNIASSDGFGRSEVFELGLRMRQGSSWIVQVSGADLGGAARGHDVTINWFWREEPARIGGG